MIMKFHRQTAFLLGKVGSASPVWIVIVIFSVTRWLELENLKLEIFAIKNDF